MPPRASLPFLPQQALPLYARTAGRGVRLKIRPRPRNLQDSRHILTYLQSYGHIVLYQYLKYDPIVQSENVALALYRDEADATKLLEAGPLKLEIGPEGAKRVRQEQQQQQESGGKNVTQGSASAGVFDVWVERSRTNFQARQQRQIYSGSFKLDTGTAMFEDLRRRVPIPAMGDSRFETGGVPLRLRMHDGKRQRWKRGQSLWDMWKRKRED